MTCSSQPQILLIIPLKLTNLLNFLVSFKVVRTSCNWHGPWSLYKPVTTCHDWFFAFFVGFSLVIWQFPFIGNQSQSHFFQNEIGPSSASRFMWYNLKMSLVVQLLLSNYMLVKVMMMNCSGENVDSQSNIAIQGQSL
jgi:hypothetical protein